MSINSDYSAACRIISWVSDSDFRGEVPSCCNIQFESHSLGREDTRVSAVVWSLEIL